VAVARLHLAGAELEFPFPGPHQATELIPLADRLADAVGEQDPATSQLLRVEARYQEAVPDAGLPSGIVHADLFRDNVLFVPGQARVAALIDFQMVGRGPWIYDLAVILLDAGFAVLFQELGI